MSLKVDCVLQEAGVTLPRFHILNLHSRFIVSSTMHEWSLGAKNVQDLTSKVRRLRS